MRRLACWITIWAATLPSALGAQDEVAPVQPGERVRVLCADFLPWHVGTLIALSTDTLVLQVDRGVVERIPLEFINRLQASRGTHSSGGTPLWIGPLVGASLGGVVGAATTSWETAAVGVAAGGAVGAVINFVFRGKKTAVERWQEAPLPFRGVVLAPLRGSGLAAMVTLPF